jgi:shikimate dehydrogenase
MKTTWHFGLLGLDISYTKSPEIFRAIGELTGYDISFDILSISPDDFNSKLSSIRNDGYDGLSITIPHKLKVIPVLDDIDPIAKTIGAVNCIRVQDQHLKGFNTDWIGFGYPLADYKGDIQKKRAVVFGTGGAAKAVVYSLIHDFHVGFVTVVTRNSNKTAILQQYQDAGNIIEITSKESFVKEKSGEIPHASIVVNATPLGGPNHVEDCLFPDGLVLGKNTIYYDLNYNDENRLTGKAREWGCKVIDGKPMLVSQAVNAFEIWTNYHVCVTKVFDAVFGEHR